MINGDLIKQGKDDTPANSIWLMLSYRFLITHFFCILLTLRLYYRDVV